MPYVYSKLSAHVDYTSYAKTAMDAAVVERVVTIRGRANVIGELANGVLETPEGAVTRVTDEELALLQQNEVFKLHERNGFISWDNKNISLEKKTANMQKRDNSAQLTPDDYKNTVPLVSDDGSAEPGKVIGAVPDDVIKKRRNH